MLALRAPGQGPPSYSPNRILIDLQKAVYSSSQFSQITIKQSHLLETCHYWRPYPRALEMSCQPDTHFINHLDRQFRGLVACITRRSPCKRQLLHFWCLSPEFAKLIYLTILSKLWCCADTTIVLFFFFFEFNWIGPIHHQWWYQGSWPYFDLSTCAQYSSHHKLYLAGLPIYRGTLWTWMSVYNLQCLSQTLSVCW